jgi:hypothetical protein
MTSTSLRTEQPSRYILRAIQDVQLRCHSFLDRHTVLTALYDAMTRCGCWVESRQTLISSRLQFDFELPLCVADDLYAELISAGIEMKFDSHRAMTWLCTLRRHDVITSNSFHAVSIRMEIDFRDEYDMETGTMPMGHA